MPSYWNKTLANSAAATTTWNFTSWIPQAVVINLGTNDYSTTPYPPQSVFQDAYLNFINEIQQDYGSQVEIFLVCGPLIGNPCCQYVQNVSELANVNYINMQNILNSTDYGCDGHPNVDGHRKMFDVAFPIIQKVMQWF